MEYSTKKQKMVITPCSKKYNVTDDVKYNIRPDPFANNLRDWRDETVTTQPQLPLPVNDLNKQPVSLQRVKQNRVS
tara:strand:+ start:209 stop:436 length:228 start_codon:yes stop_codon:yes gene_type:complete